RRADRIRGRRLIYHLVGATVPPGHRAERGCRRRASRERPASPQRSFRETSDSGPNASPEDPPTEEEAGSTHPGRGGKGWPRLVGTGRGTFLSGAFPPGDDRSASAPQVDPEHPPDLRDRVAGEAPVRGRRGEGQHEPRVVGVRDATVRRPG